MTAPRNSLLALLLLCFVGVPAEAASISLTLDAPLYDTWGSSTALIGSLLYDADLMSGSGTFEIAGYSNTFAGFALALDTAFEEPSSDIASWASIGVLFSGDAEDGSTLYFNIDTGPNSMLTDNVHLCRNGLNCEFYSSAASPSVTAPVEPPLVDTGLNPTGVSAVPLPPAMSLFGSALMMLGVVTLGRRVLARQKSAA